MGTSKKELDLLKALIKRELNMDVADENAVDSMPEGEIYRAIQDLFGDEFASSVTTSQQPTRATSTKTTKKKVTPKNKTETKAKSTNSNTGSRTSKKTSAKSTKSPTQKKKTSSKKTAAPKKPRAASKTTTKQTKKRKTSKSGLYPQLIDTAYEMALDIVDRMGDDYIPFVESSGHYLRYGAGHKADPSNTVIRELALPNTITSKLPPSEEISSLGESYRWAMAEYERIRKNVREAFDTSKFKYKRVTVTNGKISVKCQPSRTKTWIEVYSQKIPLSVRRILGDVIG